MFGAFEFGQPTFADYPVVAGGFPPIRVRDPKTAKAVGALPPATSNAVLRPAESNPNLPPTTA